MRAIKKEKKKAEDLTPQEIEVLRRYLTKNSKEVEAPKDSLLQGKEAIKSRKRGIEIKGDFNWRLNPKDPLIMNK